MFRNAFFEGAISKFTHVLKCIFWGSNYFGLLFHGCCFMLLWLPISVACLFLFECTHFYLLLICKNLFLSVRTCMTVKHQKYWYFFFLLKTLWHEYQIMKSNIMPHNNITTKSLILIFFITILQLKTFKTQITTNTRTLVYHGPNE